MMEQNKQNDKTKVAIVDDDTVMLQVVKSLLDKKNFQVVDFDDPGKLLEYFENDNHVDMIVIDKIMPGLDGVEVVNILKQKKEFRNMPIIMLTGEGDDKSMKKGIMSGVFYYLVKPINEVIFYSVIASANRQAKRNKILSQELLKHRSGFMLIQIASFDVASVKHIEQATCFIASCYPEPQKVSNGIYALLSNALEYGNLGIEPQDKQNWIKNSLWKEKLENISKQKDIENNPVKVVLERKKEGIFLQITDTGKGFDWKKYINVNLDRSRVEEGKGIAMAKLVSFDQIVYNEQGNQVTCIVRT